VPLFLLFITNDMHSRVDIVDDSTSSLVVATLELPGVRNDEVTMHLHEGKLYIHGERRPRTISQEPKGPADSPQLFSSTSDAVVPNDMIVDTLPRRSTLPVQELKYGKFQRTLDVPNSLKVSIFEPRHNRTHVDSFRLLTAHRYFRSIPRRHAHRDVAKVDVSADSQTSGAKQEPAA